MPNTFGWVDEPIAISTAVCLAAIGSCISLVQIYDHLSHWTHPHLQKYVTRILLLLPVYAVNSSASLIAGDPVSVYLDTIRDAYEGYVLYQFMALLIELCGGDQELMRQLNEKGRMSQHHMFWQRPCKIDRQFVNHCRKCVLQYAFVKPLLAATTIICTALGVYKENQYSLDTAYLYVIIVYNISVSISLYYLVVFGYELGPELVYFTPKSKFLCIKSVIFFAFWQSFAISIFGFAGLLGSDHPDETGIKLQDFLICCELVGVAILHHRAFRYSKMCKQIEDSPYLVAHLPKMDPGVAAQSKTVMLNHLKSVLDINDLVQDSHKAFVKGTKNALLDSGYEDGEEHNEHNIHKDSEQDDDEHDVPTQIPAPARRKSFGPNPLTRASVEIDILSPTEDADSHHTQSGACTPDEGSAATDDEDEDTFTNIDLQADTPKEYSSRRRLSSLPNILQFSRK
eukprot:TRINITY_DN1404_c1_g1_i2.p1 TRINITY_DN1404_c1_g1~~TRINITY_DN1404_c1_g1_i2.p1  ORF type:complete len:455 (+),score=83.57 TRINITY_DN1404_c1_g1_i2:50-1414(+)